MVLGYKRLVESLLLGLVGVAMVFMVMTATAIVQSYARKVAPPSSNPPLGKPEVLTTIGTEGSPELDSNYGRNPPLLD